MHGAVADEAWDEVLAEVADAGAAGVVGGSELAAQLVEGADEGLGLVDEDLGGDRRRGRPVGLVVDAGDLLAATDGDDGLVGGLGPADLGRDDGAVAAPLEVGVDDGPQVEGEDLVGRHDDDRVGAEVPDGVGVAVEVVAVAAGEAVDGERAPALLRHQPAQPAAGAVEVPGAARGEVPVERGGLVLHREPDVGDAAVRQVGQGDVDELVAAAERQGRLGALAGEDVHPGALPPGLDDRQHLRRRPHAATVPHGARANPPRVGR